MRHFGGRAPQSPELGRDFFCARGRPPATVANMRYRHFALGFPITGWVVLLNQDARRISLQVGHVRPRSSQLGTMVYMPPADALTLGMELMTAAFEAYGGSSSTAIAGKK